MMRNITDAEAAKLGRKFRPARPFPHAIIEDFLASHRQLLAALKKESFYRKDSDLFSFSQTNNLAYAKTAAVREAVAMLSSREFAQLISKITGLRLKPGAIDVFGALYRKADYLLCHDDRLEGRKIAFILYLSESFGAADGGALVLLSNQGAHPGRKIVAYPPLENSLAIFEVSKNSWHEVEEMLTGKERYTIGGWLH